MRSSIIAQSWTLGAAGAGMNREDRAAEVVCFAEHPPELEALDPLDESGHDAVELFGELLVAALQELGHLVGVAKLSLRASYPSTHC